jgi:hypothetical protein
MTLAITRASRVTAANSRLCHTLETLRIGIRAWTEPSYVNSSCREQVANIKAANRGTRLISYPVVFDAPARLTVHSTFTVKPS